VRGVEGTVLLEFSIPRMGRRIDAVLLVGPVVFAIEFKVGESAFHRAAYEQVWDYALDLKNFHEASHAVAIVPVLVATEAVAGATVLHADPDGVSHPVAVGGGHLREVIDRAVTKICGDAIDPELWRCSPYRPTPTIIEAARALYAHRAWNLRQTANFMKRKKNRPGFSQSEPEFLISVLDRHRDWAVIICLVGGGQEINLGEAGIGAWLDALETCFPDWRLCISSRLTDSEYDAGRAIDRVRHLAKTRFDDALHLAVSMRSFRAENVSAFVKALLDCEAAAAQAAAAQLVDRYPIALTRDLARAKAWVRARARGSERFGLAS